MHCYLYRFIVREGSEAAFEQAWTELTYLFRDYAGGLGSRLHQAKAQEYIAYAQWPDPETRDKASEKLPAEAAKWRQQMQAACLEIETLQELKMLKDLLV